MHYTADGRVISENNNLVEKKPLRFNYETNNYSNVSSVMNKSIFGNEDSIIELPKSNIVNTGYNNYLNLVNFEDPSDAFVLSNISNNKFPYGLSPENTKISLNELQTNKITNIPFQNNNDFNVNQQVPLASASQPSPFAFIPQQSQFDFISQPLSFSQQPPIASVSQQVPIASVSQQVPIASQPAPLAFVPQQSPFDFVFQPLLFSQQAPVISQQAPVISQQAPVISQQAPINLLPSAFLIQNEKTNLPISNNDSISLFSMENVIESSMENVIESSMESPISTTELIPIFSMEDIKSIVEIPNLPIIQSSENDFVEFPNSEQDLLNYEPNKYEDQNTKKIQESSSFAPTIYTSSLSSPYYLSLETPYVVQSSYNAPSSDQVQSSYNAPSSDQVQSSYIAPSSDQVQSSYIAPSSDQVQSSYIAPSSNQVQSSYNAPSSDEVINTILQSSLENLSEQELIDTLLKEGVSIDSLIPTGSIEDIMNQDIMKEDIISQTSEISDETLRLFQNQINKLASMNI